MIAILKLLGNRRVLISVALVAGLLAVAFWPSTTPVDTAVVGRGALVVTVDEEGITRVRDRFVVSAPVSGRVLRIELEPGDRVKRGEVVARVRAEAPPLLDARTRAEAQAAAEGARAALGRARAEEQRARTTLEQAERDLVRLRQLAEERVISRQELEARETEAKAAQDSVNAAAFAARAAESDLQRAEARLVPMTTEPAGRIVAVVAPVDGVILKRVRESETVVPAGDPLVEIGDPRQLEIVADLLSTDAVRVAPGARAIIDEWGGDRPLAAKVRRIDPAGFTKVSALGVEEQRVNVVLDFAGAPPPSLLGDGYRVEVRVVVWEGADVLKVPTSALFRDGEQWAVYRVEGGRARRTRVQLGHQTGLEAEVKQGLSAGDVVVVHPGQTLADDARVSARVDRAAGSGP